MKKIIYLILFLLFPFLSLTKDIIGSWKFESIRYEIDTLAVDIKEIGEDDFFYINNDGTFSYDLNEISLHANGSWNLEEDILSLNYDRPSDTIRYYKIEVLENSLLLNENGINYRFISTKETIKYSTLLEVILVLSICLAFFGGARLLIKSIKT